MSQDLRQTVRSRVDRMLRSSHGSSSASGRHRQHHRVVADAGAVRNVPAVDYEAALAARLQHRPAAVASTEQTASSSSSSSSSRRRRVTSRSLLSSSGGSNGGAGDESLAAPRFVDVIEYSVDASASTATATSTSSSSWRQPTLGRLVDAGNVLLTPLYVLFGALLALPRFFVSIARMSVDAHSTSKQRSGRWLLAFALALIAYAILYGVRTVYDACDYEAECVRRLPVFASMLATSKTAAKIFLFTYTCLVLVVTKPVTNFLEETKVNRYAAFSSWRLVHVALYSVALLAALVHAAGHAVRRAVGEIDLSDLYEQYEQWTGVLLFALFVFMALPFHVIRKATHRAGAPLSKYLFRRSHHLCFYALSLLLCIHAWQVTPFAVVAVYLYSYHYSRLELAQCFVRVEQDGKPLRAAADVDRARPFLIELCLEGDGVVPQSFGFFVTLSVGRFCALSASYTLIPIDDRRFRLAIGRGTLALALLDALRGVGAAPHAFDGARHRFVTAPADGDWLRLDAAALAALGVRAYGFFRSFDETFGNRRHLLALVRGTGRVVSDAVLSYHANFRAYDSILLIHESRRAYADYSAVVRSLGHLGDVAALEDAVDAVAASDDDGLLGAVRAAARDVRVPAASRTPVSDAILRVWLGARRVPSAPRVLVANVRGALCEADVRGLLDCLLIKNKQRYNTEVLVVGGGLRDVVENVFDAQSTNYPRELLHIEEFSL